MNLDKIVNRKNTYSIKWDRFSQYDAIPLWVADMDFESPKAVQEALSKRISHNIYGYTRISDEYYEAVIQWFKNRHGWAFEKDEVIYTPGVVTAIALAINAYTEEGDEVIIQPPVYFPFKKKVLESNRHLLENKLKLINNHYEFDFEDLEEKASGEKCKLLILCHPHNPVGRVWTKEELLKIGEICEKYNILVISDEIHCDLTYKNHTHKPYASLSKVMANHSITATAPSKTFNIAGLDVSNVIIKNKRLRTLYLKELNRYDLTRPNVLSMTAATAAYKEGEAWLDEIMEYIEDNYKYLKNYLKKNLPKVKINVPEGTFLVWLDFSSFNLEDEALQEKFAKDAKVILNMGHTFGEGGKKHARVNIACSRELLKKALELLSEAFK